jgi:hypothetical protein
MVQRHILLHAPIQEVGMYRANQLAEIVLIRKKVIAEALIVPRAERPWHMAAAVLIKLQEREEKLTGLANAPTPDEFEAMTDEELAQYAA